MQTIAPVDNLKEVPLTSLMRRYQRGVMADKQY